MRCGVSINFRNTGVVVDHHEEVSCADFISSIVSAVESVSVRHCIERLCIRDLKRTEAEYKRSWVTENELPAFSTVNALCLAATLGTYLALAPMKKGWVPVGSTIVNLSAAKLLIGPLGSFKIRSATLPVLVRVVENLRSPTRLTVSGPSIRLDASFHWKFTSKRTSDLQGKGSGCRRDSSCQ